MSTAPPTLTPLFTLAVYLEDDQVKSIHTFRDPACGQHRRQVVLLLRRAVAALTPEIDLHGVVSSNANGFHH